VRPHRKRSGETGHLRTSDLELVRRARDGDEVACHALVDRFAPELYRLALFLVGDAADAEDVLQETFSGAFRHLGRFAGRSSVRTWLSGILVRQAARCRRSRKRARLLSLDPQHDRVRETGSGAPGAAETADLRMDVASALETLAPIHREVIVLRELQGFTYEEIAEALSLPRGTVESRLFRARRILRQLLKDYTP